jgi:hypothetical protein
MYALSIFVGACLCGREFITQRCNLLNTATVVDHTEAVQNLYTFKEPRIVSEESIPPDWESIPGLLKRLTNTDCVFVSLSHEE